MVELVWICFLALFLGLLVLDLSVLHRESATLSVKQALFWTSVWVTVAMSFAGVIYGLYEFRWLGFEPGQGVANGTDAVIQYVTGYLLEWSLSVDNIFVIALIFSYLRIPTQYQYRVLFWGIVGAIVLRGMMIAAGTTLLHHFDWMFYVFGAILLLSALRMLRNGDDTHDVGNSFPARLIRRFVPVTPEVCDAALRRPRDGGTHRRRLRGRLDPGDPRGHPRPVPRLLVQRLRDPGSAVALFRGRGPDGHVPLPALQPGADPGFRRHEDAAGVAFSCAEPGVARHHPGHAGCRRHCIGHCLAPRRGGRWLRRCLARCNHRANCIHGG
jgi:Integral membrane protein TerC family